MTTIASHPSPHGCPGCRCKDAFVYRFINDEDVVIYVGMTDTPRLRMLQHEAKSEFWPDFADVVIEELPSKRHALDRERELIWELRPEHNKLVRSPLPAVVSALAQPTRGSAA